MNDLELEEQRMLAAARRHHEPDPGAARRVRIATLATLSAPVPPGTGEGALDVLWHAPGRGVRLVAAALLALGSGWVGYAISPATRATPATPASTARTAPAVTTATEDTAAHQPAASTSIATPPTEPEPKPASASLTEPAARKPSATRTPRAAEPTRANAAALPAASLQAELAALKRIEAEQRAGHAERVLSLLQALDDDIPDGRLMEERRAAYVIARCTAGTHAPRALVQDFIRAFPHSVYTARLRDRCLDESP